MAEPIAPHKANTPGAQHGKRRARPWHRVLGLLVALPLIWVVITGALLNHTVDWKLDQMFIDSPVVLKVYGMVPDGEPRGKDVVGHVVAEWDGIVFYDSVPLPVLGNLVGATDYGDEVVIVTDASIVRLGNGGDVIEVLDELSLPDLPLMALKVVDGSVWIQNRDGWHMASGDWLSFEKNEQVVWEVEGLAAITDEDEKARLRRAWSGGGLPASRFLLDLHGAKFLGSVSKYFYDLVAICTIWLSVTGVILFFRKSRKSKMNEKV